MSDSALPYIAAPQASLSSSLLEFAQIHVQWVIYGLSISSVTISSYVNDNHMVFVSLSDFTWYDNL